MSKQQNIRIILVEPTHPGNIGATARAMKNMDLSELHLVNPKLFPHVEATARAAGADKILKNAHLHNELDEAIADCSLIIGTSARLRSLSLPLLTARESAEKIHTKHQQDKIAIIFGRESSGLNNEELYKCNYHIHIPTAEEFSSLNLAQAVQIVVYELRMASLQYSTNIKQEYTNEKPATAAEMEHFYQHLQKVLAEIEFLKPSHTKKMLLRLRRLFNKANLEQVELNILEGILSQVEYKLRK
ncbi:MAG: RNA methyltransferase [Gammaproteobacteria bacterium]|nr:RNA methyltransferase [Gammaproteobacteria bacterium]